MISVAERQAYIGRVRDLAKARVRRMAGDARRLMADFLLELLSEEIPARMQAERAQRACAAVRGVHGAKRGSRPAPIDAHSTPRRLVLIARDVAEATEASREEIKGPRTSAPPQALEGFLRKTGLRQDQLEERDGVYFAVVERPGRPAAEILGETVKRIVADFAWPKSMRWGSGSLRWVRPLHGIVAMLGEEIVPVEIDGIARGATTVGHRFHHPGDDHHRRRADYIEKLRACHVIVDQEERERIIREGAEAAAAKAGLSLLGDEGLVVENAGLTEWPVPLLGEFDPDFLDVPREVIVLTMRTNQKYFACTAPTAGWRRRSSASRISPRATAARRSSRATAGCSPRASPTPASSGSRTSRCRSRSRRRSSAASSSTRSSEPSPTRSSASPSSRGGWSRAASSKPTQTRSNAPRAWPRPTLSPGMVGEFPELQGVIGGYLAEAQGQPKAVADAIRDHYKPAGQGDDVPSEPVSVAVALADKLDYDLRLLRVGLKPTGSKDPFALRRAAIASIEIIVRNGLRLPLTAGASGIAREPRRAGER